MRVTSNVLVVELTSTATGPDISKATIGVREALVRAMSKLMGSPDVRSDEVQRRCLSVVQSAVAAGDTGVTVSGATLHYDSDPNALHAAWHLMTRRRKRSTPRTWLAGPRTASFTSSSTKWRHTPRTAPLRLPHCSHPQCAELISERHTRINPVQLEQFDPVDTKPAQSLIDLTAQDVRPAVKLPFAG